MEKFKLSLKAARINAELTQAEAAKKLNVSKDTIAIWEKGERDPRVNQLRDLCKIYKCPEDIIFLKHQST